MDLCSSYTASAGQKSIKDATSCAIGDLWKRDVDPENDVLPADNKQTGHMNSRKEHGRHFS